MELLQKYERVKQRNSSDFYHVEREVDMFLTIGDFAMTKVLSNSI